MTHALPECFRSVGDGYPLSEEFGETLASGGIGESEPSALQGASEKFGVLWVAVNGGLGALVEIVLDASHVDGSVREKMIWKDADGLASELTEEAEDADHEITFWTCIAQVGTVSLQTRAVFMMKGTGRKLVCLGEA